MGIWSLLRRATPPALGGLSPHPWGLLPPPARSVPLTQCVMAQVVPCKKCATRKRLVGIRLAYAGVVPAVGMRVALT